MSEFFGIRKHLAKLCSCLNAVEITVTQTQHLHVSDRARATKSRNKFGGLLGSEEIAISEPASFHNLLPGQESGQTVDIGCATLLVEQKAQANVIHVGDL